MIPVHTDARPDWRARGVMLGLFLLFWGIYLASGAWERSPYYAHAWLSQAMLHGQFHLLEAPRHFELVPLGDKHYLSYGIGPSLLMLPFVAIWGLDFHQGIFNAALGGLAVATWWSVLGKLGTTGAARNWLTACFALGSLFWFYAGQASSTWWMLHTLTALCLLIAIHETLGRRRGWVVGLAFGLAVLTRTTVLFTIPFFLAMLWRDDRSQHGTGPMRKELGFLIALGVLMAFNAWYNWVCFGNPLDSGYNRFISKETAASAGPFSPAYLWQNVQGYFLRLPERLADFPWFNPTRDGFNFLISLPALLLALRADYRKRVNLLALLACLTVLALYMNYYWSGYVQFGRRYTVDLLPFAMLLIASGARNKAGPVLIALTLAGVVVEVWGITWWHFQNW